MKLNVVYDFDKAYQILFVLPYISIYFFSIIREQKFLLTLSILPLHFGIILIAVNRESLIVI